MSLLDSFRRAAQPSAKPKDGWTATTDTLREMIPECPACGLALDGHAHCTLAEAGNKHDVEQLFKAIERRDWNTLVSIQSFEGSKNAVIATAIRCPRAAGSVQPYVDYVELYSAPERCEHVVLNDEEWRDLNDALATLSWYSF